jgi:uncharacterized membrane protein YfcA
VASGVVHVPDPDGSIEAGLAAWRAEREAWAARERRITAWLASGIVVILIWGIATATLGLDEARSGWEYVLLAVRVPLLAGAGVVAYVEHRRGGIEWPDVLLLLVTAQAVGYTGRLVHEGHTPWALAVGVFVLLVALLLGFGQLRARSRARRLRRPVLGRPGRFSLRRWK